MSAVSRLWRRAPLWRLCVYGTVFFAGLAAFYPAGYLIRAIPSLGKLHPGALHGGTAPDAPKPGPGPGGNGGPLGPGDGRISFLPLTQGLTRAVPFGGHVLPLPAGVWHPVLSAQTGPNGAMLTDVYVRTDRGVVSGMVVAMGTAQPIPDPNLLSVDSPCHDDRAYARGELPSGENVVSCWAIGATPVHDAPGTLNPVVAQAVDRLNALGYPIPPLFMTMRWMHLTTVPKKGVGLEQADVMLSPAAPGTIRLPVPIDQWDRGAIAGAPAAAHFVDRMRVWAQEWAPILERGHAGTLDPTTIPDSLTMDPAAPAVH